MIGSLGLFRQLAALGRAAPKGSAADLNKRVARLPEDAKARFKVIRAEQKSKIDAARSAAQAEFDKFLEDYGMPPRADYRAERKVVAAFIFGMSERGAGLETDGMTLRVNGREVAKRSSDPTDRYLKVCPGGFGEDRTSRRAANAALDILGAGVRVDDRDDRAFLRSSKGGGRGVVSSSACYTVDVTKKIRARAADALMSGELIGQSSLLPIRAAKAAAKAAKSGEMTEGQAAYMEKLRARRDARTKKALEEFATSGEFDGLGSMGRKSRKSRKSRR